jgi:hypothetical protein
MLQDVPVASAIDALGRSLAHYAIEADRLDLLSLAAHLGVPLSAADLEGRTPLHLAAFLGRRGHIIALLEHHRCYGDLVKRDSSGQTPRDLAVVGEHVGALYMLLNFASTAEFDEASSDAEGNANSDGADEATLAQRARALFERNEDGSDSSSSSSSSSDSDSYDDEDAHRPTPPTATNDRGFEYYDIQRRLSGGSLDGDDASSSSEEGAPRTPASSPIKARMRAPNSPGRQAAASSSTGAPPHHSRSLAVIRALGRLQTETIARLGAFRAQLESQVPRLSSPSSFSPFSVVSSPFSFQRRDVAGRKNCALRWRGK